MCESRITNNLEPACVKACPTGALSWGPKEKMLKTAAKRVEQLGGDAATYGDQYVKGTHFMYVLKEKRPSMPTFIKIRACHCPSPSGRAG